MEKDPSYRAAPKDPAYPAVRYHPDGRSVRVLSVLVDQGLKEEGWSAKPFPPSEPKPERLDLQGQLDELEKRVSAVERLLAAKPDAAPVQPPIKKAS